jgi:hypothetical protein
VAIWPEASGGGTAPAWDAGPCPDATVTAGSSFATHTRRAERKRPRSGGWRTRLAWIGAAIAATGLAASLAGVVLQLLPRAFTAAQQQQIISWEIGGRWRAWPAGRIFPPAVRYDLPGSVLTSEAGLGLTARRAAIAPQAGCPGATDPPVGRVLAAHGCLAMLRAAYDDATGSMAVTVGVAVFRSAAAERAAARALPAGVLPGGSGFAPGVRPVWSSGVAAVRFGPAQRQLTLAASHGPYLVLAAAGYTDGRPRVHESADPYALAEMRSMAAGVAGSIGSALAAPPPAPHCPGTPGC